MNKSQKMEPAYRKIVIEDPRMENKALEILYGLGVPFKHIAIREYEITSGQCQLLREKGVNYRFKR
jgi:hypothetical protein